MRPTDRASIVSSCSDAFPIRSEQICDVYRYLESPIGGLCNAIPQKNSSHASHTPRSRTSFTRSLTILSGATEIAPLFSASIFLPALTAQRLKPQLPRRDQRIDGVLAPEGALVANGMEGIVMDGTKRNGELITDFEGEASGLCEGDVMGMAG